jgi:hypothetical protein
MVNNGHFLYRISGWLSHADYLRTWASIKSTYIVVEVCSYYVPETENKSACAPRVSRLFSVRVAQCRCAMCTSSWFTLMLGLLDCRYSLHDPRFSSSVWCHCFSPRIFDAKIPTKYSCGISRFESKETLETQPLIARNAFCFTCRKLNCLSVPQFKTFTILTDSL